MKANKSIILHKIRSLIPKMNCIAGCSDCCGPVVFEKIEWDKVRIKKKGTSIHCPYITGQRTGCCEIYEDRPIICRLYGTIERLVCPHGVKPEKMLLPDEEKRILFLWKMLRVKSVRGFCK